MTDICPFEPGAWHGRFYGQANANIGSYMKTVADGVKRNRCSAPTLSVAA